MRSTSVLQRATASIATRRPQATTAVVCATASAAPRNARVVRGFSSAAAPAAAQQNKVDVMHSRELQVLRVRGNGVEQVGLR